MAEDLHTGTPPTGTPPPPLLATPPPPGPPWPCAWTEPLDPPPDHEALSILRKGDRESEAVEALAVFQAGARGAIDVAIGEGLAAMRKRDRLMSVGFSSVRDYAREVLGIQERRRRRWSILPTVASAAVPPAAFDDGASAREIDAELRRLVAMRSGWGASLGHAAQSVNASGLWELLGFDSFSRGSRRASRWSSLPPSRGSVW